MCVRYIRSLLTTQILEIIAALLISFIARGLSTTGVFCYQAVASAGVVNLLPCV